MRLLYAYCVCVRRTVWMCWHVMRKFVRFALARAGFDSVFPADRGANELLVHRLKQTHILLSAHASGRITPSGDRSEHIFSVRHPLTVFFAYLHSSMEFFASSCDCRRIGLHTAKDKRFEYDKLRPIHLLARFPVRAVGFCAPFHWF